jgi:predicted nucleic acid-binding protein
VIYLDTSVVLAQLFAEDRRAPDALWVEPVTSSRLLEYEVWTRVHRRRAAETHGEATRALLGRVALVELAPVVLARALEPFPIAVRTLDALHLATAAHLAGRGLQIALATFDARMREAAAALGLRIASIDQVGA